MVLSEVFFMALMTTISGLLIKCLSMAYKSKCKEVSLCCLKIVRDVELEEKEQEFMVNHPPSSPKETSQRSLNI